MIWIRFKKRDDTINTPKYAHDGDSGMDLEAAFEDAQSKYIYPEQILMVPTGLSLEIPYKFEGQVRPRSGLACKCGVTVVNAPGTIDSTYRGEVKVGLINFSDSRIEIKNGDRIAQLVICPVEHVIPKEVSDFNEPETSRGSNGFGSTGINGTTAIKGDD